MAMVTQTSIRSAVLDPFSIVIHRLFRPSIAKDVIYEAERQLSATLEPRFPLQSPDLFSRPPLRQAQWLVCNMDLSAPSVHDWLRRQTSQSNLSRISTHANPCKRG